MQSRSPTLHGKEKGKENGCTRKVSLLYTASSHQYMRMRIIHNIMTWCRLLNMRSKKIVNERNHHKTNLSSLKLILQNPLM